MGAALLGCRLVLAGMFAIAGVAKLADLGGSRDAMAGFGIPPGWARFAGAALPAVELAVAAALIPVASARFGALAGALVLAGFSAAIANAIAHGRTPDCHCFGQLHSAPAGPKTLARNGALLALALFVAVAGWNAAGRSATHWVARPSAPWLVAIAAGVVAVVETVLILLLHRQNRRLRAHPTAPQEPGPQLGLPVGSHAPEFQLEGVDGERHSLRSLQSGRRPLLLVFVDARCAPCDLLMPALAEWQERLRIAVVASGDAKRNRAKAAEHGLAQVLLETGREVAEAYRAHGTPMAVLVADGRVASPTVAGGKPIAQLAQQAADAPRPAPPAPGEPAPTLVLSDLAGEPVALADLYGGPTMLIFWSPRCEHSQKLLPGLRALSQELPSGLPKLVVISDGEPEDLRAHALGWPVLLDPDHRARAAFGARATPMAVLVADSMIASSLVAGPAPVFDLLDAAMPAAGQSPPVPTP